MVMLTANPRNAGRCIYCAFRSRQLVLQARRHKSTAVKHMKPTGPDASAAKHSRPTGPDASASAPKLRIKYSDREYSDRERGKRDSGRGNAGKTVGDGLVRKNFKGTGSAHWSFARQGRGAQENYNDVLLKRLKVLKAELSEAPLFQQLDKDAGQKEETFSSFWRTFTGSIVIGADRAIAWANNNPIMEDSRVSNIHQALQTDLHNAYRTRGVRALDDRIKYAFYGHVTGSRFTESDVRNQVALADLRYPTEWYPATRSLHRSIHLHVGPTNSGKTYQALQRLEAAESGVYAGPLRLLAHEVYTRMNAKGKPCALITGEERRGAAEAVDDPDGLSGSRMSACTVEMMPLNTTMDVAVIDEIQMIGSADRGWAWTQALLGVKAKEVHLCGEERTVPLIRELCASVGETVEVHRYERLSPLKVAEASLDGDLSKLRKGDCIVSFSVMGIHALRRQIERQTGKKVATVYGSLPPETRAQQARLFNDPHNDYDYLVASDAVGMGLNLAIKRMIFESSSKFDGVQQRTLGVADVKQIGGRAGRYRTAQQADQSPASAQDLAAAKGDSPRVVTGADGKMGSESADSSVGLVTTLEKFDHPIITAAMNAEPEPIRTAGLYPPASVLERFASYFPPGTPFSYILTRLHELSQIHSRFHLCGLKDQLFIADYIEPVPGLTITDRNVICSAPCSKGDEMWKLLMPAFARCIAEQKGGDLLDIAELPLEVLELEEGTGREYLRALERLHKGVGTYLWLSYRFAGIFRTRPLAFHVKGLVEEKIEKVLSQFSFSETVRKKLVEQRQEMLMRDMLDPLEGEAEEDEVLGGGVGSKSSRDGDRLRAAMAAEFQELGKTVEGGARFSGEEDVVLEDPGMFAVAAESTEAGGEDSAAMAEDEVIVAGEEGVSETGTSSFAAWRARQTDGESQGSQEREGGEEGESEATIGGAFEEGEAKAAKAAERGELETITAQRPAVTEADPDTATDLDAPIGLETELEGEAPPLETQVASPLPVEESTELPAEQSPENDDGSVTTAAQPGPGPSRFGGGIPAKHLAHLDLDATEAERRVASRP
ncbi:hypothetical protein LTR08_002586 [Meristemomyces frigidus]|nr:hypothetical protein LTR08_002586 [Meristemomyces frigidus]